MDEDEDDDNWVVRADWHWMGVTRGLALMPLLLSCEELTD